MRDFGASTFRRGGLWLIGALLALTLGSVVADAAEPGIDTTISSGPATTITGESADFAFSSTTAAATFECQLDTSPYEACASPKTLDSLGVGAHTFRVRAVEAGPAKKQDETPAEQAFTVIGAPAKTHGTSAAAAPSAAAAAGMPSAVTEAASSISSNEAILNASINPNGQKTTYRFEYGTTTAYGNTFPEASEEALSGNQVVAADEALAFLQPETTYHYRVVATSPAGTAQGSDRTLLTAKREKTPEAEAQSVREELGQVSISEAVPASFMNMMWSGANTLELEDARMRAIKKSGSTYLRHSIIWEEVFPVKPAAEQQQPGERVSTPDWTFYDKLFREAAKFGITILPDIGGDPAAPGNGTYPPKALEPEYNKWNQFVTAAVQRYGTSSAFWNSVAPAERHLANTWEVGNENNYGGWDYNGVVEPADFSSFFVDTSQKIKAARPGAKVVLGGLLSVSNEAGAVQKLPVTAFLKALTPQAVASFDQLGLHPYAFKVTTEEKEKPKYEGAPRNPTEVTKLMRTIRRNVQKARGALRAVGRNDAPIAITELGFPVATDDTSHPAVTPAVQGELLTSVFTMLKANAQRFGIASAYYYNDHDISNPNWAYNCGLQGLDNHYRPSWYAFLKESGEPRWPVNPKVEVKKATATSSQATVYTSVQAFGSPTKTKVLYGETASYGGTVTQEAGSEETAVEQAIQLTGLQSSRKYHFKVIAENENGETQESGDQTFETEAPTVSTGSLDQTLNGEPGWAGFSGTLKHDQVGMNGVHVNLNLYKENSATGQFELTTTLQEPVTNGQWHAENVVVGRGRWEWRAVFSATEQGYPQSWTSDIGSHPIFTIKNAYQLVAKHSGKCLQANGTAVGSAASQGTCGSPLTTLKQDFTLVPFGNAEYQLVPRDSNRCLEVAGASQTANAAVQVANCVGASQPSQIWRGIGVESLPEGNVYAEYIAKHSGQCLSVLGSSTADGAQVVQAPCNGPGANQQFKFLSVEAGQVPTQATLTIDEVLDGHPGYVTLHGSVAANGYNMAGYTAEVNFEREVAPGSYEAVPGETLRVPLAANGSFNYSYWGVGHANWRARVVFAGSGPLAGSASEYRPFAVRDGYKLQFRQSGKCLSTSENKITNGTAILQWNCAPPNAYDGQTFTFRPVGVAGSNYFQIKPDTAAGTNTGNSGMCLEVTGSSQVAGAKVQLYQCIGESQTSQIWHVTPVAGQAPYFAAIAVHSNQCMEVAGASLSNGALFQQGSCTYAGNQQWQFIPVG